MWATHSTQTLTSLLCIIYLTIFYFASQHLDCQHLIFQYPRVLLLFCHEQTYLQWSYICWILSQFIQVTVFWSILIIIAIQDEPPPTTTTVVWYIKAHNNSVFGANKSCSNDFGRWSLLLVDQTSLLYQSLDDTMARMMCYHQQCSFPRFSIL